MNDEGGTARSVSPENCWSLRKLDCSLHKDSGTSWACRPLRWPAPACVSLTWCREEHAKTTRAQPGQWDVLTAGSSSVRPPHTCRGSDAALCCYSTPGYQNSAPVAFHPNLQRDSGVRKGFTERGCSATSATLVTLVKSHGRFYMGANRGQCPYRPLIRTENTKIITHEDLYVGWFSFYVTVLL